MTTTYLLSQIFAIAAICIGPTAFFRKEDKHVKLHIGTASLFMGVHFALLGAWVATFICVVGAVRYAIASYSKNILFYWLFIAIGTAICYVRYQTPSDFLVLFSNYLSCTAVFLLQGTRMRLALLVVTSTWIIYNALHLSIFGTVLECIYFITNLLALLRLWKQTRSRVGKTAAANLPPD